MTPNNATIEYKLTPFLCLRDNITKIVLLPNVGHTFMFMKEFEVAMNFGETSYETFTTYEMWMHHMQDPSWSTTPSKLKIWFGDRLMLLYCESHNSSIQSVIEVYEYLMAFK